MVLASANSSGTSAFAVLSPSVRRPAHVCLLAGPRNGGLSVGGVQRVGATWGYFGPTTCGRWPSASKPCSCLSRDALMTCPGGSRPASSVIRLIRVNTGRHKCAFRLADNGRSLGSWMSGPS